MNGYINLHRKLIEWEWYSDPNTKSLFIHLLLTASWKDAKWHGIEVKRGEVVTGRKELSKTLGISEQSIRTSLTRLKSTSEITSKTTNRYSVISIKNYDAYQQINQPANQQSTSNQPHLNKVISINNTNTKVLETKVVPQKNIYIECLLKEFELLFGFPPTDKKSRFVAQAFRKNIEAFLKVFNPEITYERFENVVKTYFKWISNQDYAENIQRLETIKLKFPIWSTPKVTDYKKGNHANNEPKE